MSEINWFCYTIEWFTYTYYDTPSSVHISQEIITSCMQLTGLLHNDLLTLITTRQVQSAARYTIGTRDVDLCLYIHILVSLYLTGLNYYGLLKLNRFLPTLYRCVSVHNVILHHFRYKEVRLKKFICILEQFKHAESK